MKIGVFDSGLGGITVLKRLIEEFPGNKYVYYADLKNNPYGGKDYIELKEIGKNIIRNLKKENLDMIVCACGTLSSISNNLIEETGVEIYNIIDPIVEEVNKICSKNVLLIATPATIKKGAFEEKLKKLENINNIYVEGCKEFVYIIEKDIYNEEQINKIVESYVGKYKDKIDTVIYGCTHYILLDNYIKKFLGDIDRIDAGNCAVKKLKEKIYNEELDSNLLEIILTKSSEIFVRKANKILENTNLEIKYRLIEN